MAAAARGPGAARRIGWTRAGAAFVTLLAVVWLIGLLRFAASIPRDAASPGPPVDAVVVLTGGSGRLSEGIALLQAAQGRKLFVSGVSQGVEVEELLRLSREDPEELACCITLGHRASDTHGNALETAEWMAGQGFRSLRLVTANYHMPRSLFEFRRAMPGIAIAPHPVAPANVRLDAWWLYPGTMRLVIGEYSKLLLAIVRAALGLARPPRRPEAAGRPT